MSTTLPSAPTELSQFPKLCELRRKFPVLYRVEFQVRTINSILHPPPSPLGSVSSISLPFASLIRRSPALFLSLSIITFNLRLSGMKPSQPWFDRMEERVSRGFSCDFFSFFSLFFFSSFFHSRKIRDVLERDLQVKRIFFTFL